MSKLEPRQDRFCREYIKDLNGTQAAIRAGYSEKTANEQASRLLAKSNIQERVKSLMDQRNKRLEVDGDQVLKELMRLGYSDVRGLYKEDGTVKHPSEWSDELARAVASIEVEELFEGYGQDRKWVGYTKKVKFWNKNNALDLLGKHKKLFTEKIEHSGKVTLEELVAGSEKPSGTEDDT